ncbi:ABC transporter permease [uncultured Paludibaculum sp.]|uniref:ABC transporter permease n=1 Tax=uncultured Paludibaculum sp. TaxID=1765020 RepID=UPI002AAB3722|nr:ABC transporter permease [uncultured Paludibaculum sp.]
MLSPKHWPYRLRLRLRTLLHRDDVERDLQDEFAFHLEMEIEANRKAGLSEQEARLAAHRQLARAPQHQEACRDHIFGSFESWTRDLRYAARTLRRSAGFSLTVILTLALGIGGTTAVFCAMDRLLLRPLPYPEPGRLVAVHETQTGKGFRPVSLPNLLDWHAGTHSFQAMAGFMTRTFGLRGGHGDTGSPISVINTAMVTSDLFRALGVGPALGRAFTGTEETTGKQVVLLSDELWAGQFNRDPAILGRVVQLNEQPFEVIGILPPGFVFPTPGIEVGAYIPFDHHDYNGRDTRPMRVVARLKPGTTFAQAQTEIRAIGAHLAEAWPQENLRGGADIEPLDDSWKSSLRQPLFLLTAAALLLLAIVCTNVVNLILARALARGREMAIRAALGAGLSAVIRQMLAEALLLTAAGGGLGLFLSFTLLRGLPVVLRFSGAVQPINALVLDSSTLAFASALCLLITILCGCAPALFLRSLRLNTTIKDGSEAGARRGTLPFRLRQSLVISQVALSLVLLLSAGAFLRVFLNLTARHPGFESAQVNYFGFGLPEARYSERQMVDFHRKLRDRLTAIPGVESAGAVWHLPLNGRNNTTSFQFEGAGLPRTEWSWVAYNIIDPSYFSTLRIPLLHGRPFSWETDRTGRPPAVVVNRTFERLFARTGGVLGKRVELRFQTDLAPRGQLWEIVGVVGDTYQMGLDRSIRPQIYIPISQTGLDGGSYVLRTARTDAGLAESVAAAVAAVDPNLERINLRRLDDWVSKSLGDRRAPAILTGLFALVGLLLTVLGLYGTVALEIRHRRRELAIRLALGATQTGITRLVLSRGLILSATGAVLGLVAFLLVSRLLESQLYEVTPNDPTNVVAVFLILLASTVCACLRPARDAQKHQPLTILRES